MGQRQNTVICIQRCLKVGTIRQVIDINEGKNWAWYTALGYYSVYPWDTPIVDI